MAFRVLGSLMKSLVDDSQITLRKPIEMSDTSVQLANQVLLRASSRTEPTGTPTSAAQPANRSSTAAKRPATSTSPRPYCITRGITVWNREAIQDGERNVKSTTDGRTNQGSSSTGRPADKPHHALCRSTTSEMVPGEQQPPQLAPAQLSEYAYLLHVPRHGTESSAVYRPTWINPRPNPG